MLSPCWNTPWNRLKGKLFVCQIFVDVNFFPPGRDGVTSVIAFSQYAQYCCNTTGSSINSLARYYLERNIEKPPFRLSFVDRWPQNPGLVAAFKSLIENELKQFPAEKRDSVLLLFTAHSLPLSVNILQSYTLTIVSEPLSDTQMIADTLGFFGLEFKQKKFCFKVIASLRLRVR